MHKRAVVKDQIVLLKLGRIGHGIYFIYIGLIHKERECYRRQLQYCAV